MKKRSRLGCWIGAGALVLALICAAVVGFAYLQSHSTAFASRPLVLIHAPVNHERVQVGEGVLVHATARAQRGLRRIELWADDVFVGARDADAGTKPDMLVFSGSWIPMTAADHVLIVRAVAANGIEAQASIVVAASQAAAEPQAVKVTEGASAGEAPTAGDSSGESQEPTGGGGEDPPADEAPAPEEGSEPPTPEGAPPEGFSLLLYAFQVASGLPLGEAETFDLSSEPTGLRLEFSSLTTSAAYDQLQCYVGFAGAPPRRYPDQDNDETTDETFVPEGEAEGGGVNWNIEGLAGDSMPVVLWPRNQDLPLSVWCVGIAGGGTDAVELGRWDGNIPPMSWTGMLLTGGAEDGSYHFTFRIRRTEGGGRGFDVFLDENMTGPSLAWLDDSQSTLNWEYTRPADEEAIDGFRIYLNDTLQWVRGSDVRESRLPYEWFHPLCGTSYTFGVSTYRQGLPDGPESYPAEVTLEPEEDCQREVLFTFQNLQTFELGGDQEEHFDGDVGPVYGSVYVNDQQATFDGGSLGPGIGTPSGLSDNSSYSLLDWAQSGEWQFTSNPEILLPIRDDLYAEIGFHINDRDSGRCDEPGDTGCDEVLCEGYVHGLYSIDAPQLDEIYEGEIHSDNGRCRITYLREPALGSPTGAGSDPSGIPLPWISLEDTEIDEATGVVRLHVRNTGPAGWRDQDLAVELQSREGVSLGITAWPDFVLETGERAVLEAPELRIPAPFDACVVIDPFDAVLEHREASGVRHMPVCPELPDLTIADVHFEGDDEGVGELHVIVENVGEGPLEARAVSLQVLLPGGTPLGVQAAFPGISLDAAETVPLLMEGVTSASRGQMADGYTVVVNPAGTIVESDSTNNAFEVGRAARLKFTWAQVTAPYQQRNSSSFELNADIVSGEAREPVVSWTIEDPNWGPDGCNSNRNCNLDIANEAYQTDWFDIFGDEVLEVEATAISSMIIVGREIWSYDAAMDWGGGPLDVNHDCGLNASGGAAAAGTHAFILEGRPGFYDSGVWWGTQFQICLEGVEL